MAIEGGVSPAEVAFLEEFIKEPMPRPRTEPGFILRERVNVVEFATALRIAKLTGQEDRLMNALKTKRQTTKSD